MYGVPGACRPGHGASCALCCGSHNYRASAGEIDSLFRFRAGTVRQFSPSYLISKMSSSRSALTGSYYYPGVAGLAGPYPKIFENGLQCPFVGRSGGDGPVGCLLRDGECSLTGTYECSMSYRGRIFSCAAKDGLSLRQIDYAARLFRDWYFYSLIIFEKALLEDMMDRFPDSGGVPGEELRNVRAHLERLVCEREDVHRLSGYFD